MPLRPPRLLSPRLPDRTRWSASLTGLLLVLLTCTSGCDRRIPTRDLASPDRPAVFVHQRSAMARGKMLVAQNDPTVMPAYRHLLAEANEAKAAPLLSVMSKTRVPPSGDMHDYMSLSLYYWPDPSKADGLPWISKDGVANPAALGPETDKQALRVVCKAISDLAMAWYFSDEPSYAEAAISRIQTWFLHEETRMNPHFEFAQGIPGVRTGSPWGLIDGKSLCQVVEAAQILEEYPGWRDADQSNLKSWYSRFLAWMLTSELGKAEQRATNNHGTYFVLQAVVYALYTGQEDRARALLDQAVEHRLPNQFLPDGMQPHEMTRTRTFHYHTYNLVGWFELAAAAEKVGINLWDAHKRRLQVSLNVAAPYVDPAKTWPHPELKVDRTHLYELMRRGENRYEDTSFGEQLKRHAAESFWTSTLQLTAPPLPPSP